METKDLEQVSPTEEKVIETPKPTHMVEIDIFKLYEKQQEMINTLNKQYLEILSKQEQNKNGNPEDKPLKI